MSFCFHKVTEPYLQRCASPAVCQLADSGVLGHVWQAAGEASQKKPYRGEVALAIALEGALTPPDNSVTGGRASSWNAEAMEMIAKLKRHIESAPQNMIALHPGIALTDSWQNHLLAPIKISEERLGHSRFKYTVHGGQSAAKVKYFVRAMTLFWRGVHLGDGYSLTAALVRPQFGREKYTTAKAKRDANVQPLPGRVNPWGWGLDDNAWPRELAALIEAEISRKTKNSGFFLDKSDSGHSFGSTKCKHYEGETKTIEGR